MYRHLERPVIIDQFNFIDNTEAGWTSLDESATADFLRLAATYSAENNIQIGVWSTIDWARDIVFNGKFTQGLDGWELKPSPSFNLESKSAVLDESSTLVQNLHLSLPPDHTIIVSLEIRAFARRSMLKITLGKKSEIIHISNEEFEIVEIRFDGYTGSRFELTAIEGTVFINKIMIYEKVYSQGGRHISGKMSKSFECLLEIF
jgi:hypothetical protein